jgi:hypothetical protein
VPSLPDHVIYRPMDLSRPGTKKLGVLAWGNGACAEDSASSRLHLLEIASHGYLPPPQTKASDLTQPIDWALNENQRKDSAWKLERKNFPATTAQR